MIYRRSLWERSRREGGPEKRKKEDHGFLKFGEMTKGKKKGGCVDSPNPRVKKLGGRGKVIKLKVIRGGIDLGEGSLICQRGGS